MGAYFTYYLTGFIMIPVLLFAIACQMKVKTSFNKYSRVKSSRGMTGADAAYQLLRINGINDVRIKKYRAALLTIIIQRRRKFASVKVFLIQRVLRLLVLHATKRVTHVSTLRAIFLLKSEMLLFLQQGLALGLVCHWL